MVDRQECKSIVLLAGSGVVAGLPTLALAEGTSVSTSDFQGVLTALQGQISVSTVVGVLTAGATAAVGLAFMWWGIRKLTQVLMSAFRKGKVNL